jgi:tetratricopeptide (TPR) repeat protein
MNRLSISAAALLFTIVCHGPARADGDEVAATGSQPAQPSEPEPTDDQKARELFEQGDEQYKSGRYEEALIALRRAYELSGREALLFNIANALEKLGRDEQALENLEAYAPHAPEARRVGVTARIEALRARLDAAKPAPVPEPLPAPKPEAKPETKPVQPPSSEPAPRPPADSSVQPTAVAGYALLGVGALGLGLGAAFGAVALGARSDAEASCDADAGRCLTDAADPLDDDARFSVAADVSFGIGIAAALAGGALVIHSVVVAPSGAEKQTLSVALKGGELRVIGRF